jgi:hypothetical protein
MFHTRFPGRAGRKADFVWPGGLGCFYMRGGVGANTDSHRSRHKHFLVQGTKHVVLQKFKSRFLLLVKD